MTAVAVRMSAKVGRWIPLLLALAMGSPASAASRRDEKPAASTDASESAGGKLTFELKPNRVASIEHSALSLSTNYLKSKSSLDNVKNLPEKIQGRKSWFVASVAGRTFPILLESFETDERSWFDAPMPPRLYVDTDGDGDFSDARSIRCSSGRESYGHCFGPVRLELSEKVRGQKPETASVYFRCSRADYLEILPAESRYGRIRLETKTYAVLVIDSDLDGHYDDVYSAASPKKDDRPDTLAMDFNGDRQFQYEEFVFIEVQPLTRMIHIEDDYYDVEVERDGTAIHLKKASPKFGTFSVSFPNAEIITLSDAGMHHLHGEDSQWKLPAGKYHTLSMALNAKDRRSRWRLEASGKSMGKMTSFEIPPDGKTEIKMGPPLTIKTDAAKKTGTTRGQSYTYASIGLSIEGQGGAEYATGVKCNGKQVDPPKLKIADASGKIVHAGNFEYG